MRIGTLGSLENFATYRENMVKVVRLAVGTSQRDIECCGVPVYLKATEKCEC